MVSDKFIEDQIKRLKKIVLESEDIPVKYAALGAIPNLGKKAISALIDIAEKSDDKSLRAAALKEIKNIKD